MREIFENIKNVERKVREKVIQVAHLSEQKFLHRKIRRFFLKIVRFFHITLTWYNSYDYAAYPSGFKVYPSGVYYGKRITYPGKFIEFYEFLKKDFKLEEKWKPEWNEIVKTEFMGIFINNIIKRIKFVFHNIAQSYAAARMDSWCEG